MVLTVVWHEIVFCFKRRQNFGMCSSEESLLLSLLTFSQRMQRVCGNYDGALT